MLKALKNNNFLLSLRGYIISPVTNLKVVLVKLRHNVAKQNLPGEMTGSQVRSNRPGNTPALDGSFS